MSDHEVRIERHGAVERVTLARPAALNSLTPSMVDTLLEYFAGLSRRHEVRVIVLSGEGEHFCAGLDIKGELPVLTAGPAHAMRFMQDFGEIVLRMRHCPQPVIALLNGAAAGAGMALALASDIRIATPTLRLNAAFAKIGLSGTEMGVSFLLPRMVGVGLASEWLLTGRFVDAQEAVRSGLVSRVCPAEALSDAADDMTEQLLRTAPLGLRLTKETINLGLGAASLEAAIAMENRNQALAFQSRMPLEGITAFRERRSPLFGDV